MGIDKARLFDDIVRALSLVLDWHEGAQLLHAWRVGLLAHAVGRETGVADPSLLLYAGLLHDIGAVGHGGHVVSAALQGFPDATDREHPAGSVRILRPLRVLAPVLPLIADHHERLDGAGFPAGKRADDVAPGALAVALADRVELAWRAAPPSARDEEVRRLLRAEAGRAWPAALSDAALALLEPPSPLLAALADPSALRAAVEQAGDAGPWVDGIEPVDLLGQLLWLFTRVVEAKHPATLGHAVRVTQHARRIARALGDDAPSPRDVVFVGLLHDVGMAAVPRSVVSQTGPLGEVERAALRRHARDTHAVLGSIRDFAHLATPAAAHHERYDGRGHPFGLAGEGIPLLGRILAFADAYDVRRAGGPGQPPAGHDAAMDWLRKGVGTRFDPHLAEVALAALEEGKRLEPVDPGQDALRLLLEEDAPDARGAVARSAPALSDTAERGEAGGWRVVEFDADGHPRRGLAPLRAVVGPGRGVRINDLVDPEILARLAKEAGDGEDPTEGVTLVAASGEAVEAIVRWRAAGHELLLRDAGARARTVERMALFYRNFVAGSEAAFFADAEGRVVDASAPFLALYGHARAALVGRTPPIFARTAAGEPGYAALLARAHEGVGGWIGEVTTVRADGTPVPALVTVTLVHDAARVHAGYAVRLVDLSARLRMEQELAAKNRSLEAVGRLKSELLAIASHDLKAPVAAMMSHARLLRSSIRGLPPAAAAGRLDLIVRLGQRGLALIDRMLCLEQIEAGTFRLQPLPLRIDELASACVEGLAPVALERGVHLALELRGQVRISFGDPLRLAQVLDNLVSNAVRHAPPGSRVEVACADLGDRIRFEVSDAGPGVPAPERERIFDRYYQVAGGKGGGGVGLGLHVTRTVVSLHGGRVWVEDRDGGGSRFLVELPVDRPIPAAGAPAALILDPAGRLAGQIVPLLAGCCGRPIVVRDWIEVARLSAALGPGLLVAPWGEPGVADRALAAAPGCTLVAIREPQDPPAPAGLAHAVLDTPVLDVEIAAVLRDARRRLGPAPLPSPHAPGAASRAHAEAGGAP